MHIATCFDSKESSSGYSLKHIVEISSAVHILGSQKKFTFKNTGKILHLYLRLYLHLKIQVKCYLYLQM